MSLFQGQEYVERYKLEYQREDDERWFTFRNRRNQEVLFFHSCIFSHGNILLFLRSQLYSRITMRWDFPKYCTAFIAQKERYSLQPGNYRLLLVGPRGSAIERQSLASVLSPSCARPVADG